MIIKEETHSVAQTQQLAQRVAEKLHAPVVIAFFGGLGMGKTAFTAGLAKGLEIDCDVSSPTFALVNEYHGEKASLYHFDMYRISTWDDLYTTGFFDFYENGGFLACEWSENIENALPENTIRVTFEHGENENDRIISIEGFGEYENFEC